MIPPEEVCGADAFFDCLNDPEFNAQLLLETEELFEVPVGDLEWMLP